MRKTEQNPPGLKAGTTIKIWMSPYFKDLDLSFRNHDCSLPTIHYRLDRSERNHLGVGQLRRFLEELLQKRYLENVPSIVPLLEKESRQVQVWGVWRGSQTALR